jgi:O-phospho-L-seryl-tRNASec:L-selenocysteinyl-tRNA synthase
MNNTNFDLIAGIVSKSYVVQAQQGRNQRENLIKALLSQRRLPQKGWDDQTIEFFLSEIALMDSNNFLGLWLFLHLLTK